jgi:hypothetical protein
VTISRRAKIVLGTGALIAVIVYLIIVDIGISAGRIHSGVTVNEIDVGGYTETEAVEVLTDRAEELMFDPITFTDGQNLNLTFRPFDVGWRPRVADAAHEAIRVGRDDAPFGALADRLQAWFGGVKIAWTGAPRARKVTTLIDEWQEQAAGLGLTIDAGKLRYRLKRAIVTSPRRIFNLPASRV